MNLATFDVSIGPNPEESIIKMNGVTKFSVNVDVDSKKPSVTMTLTGVISAAMWDAQEKK